jgi:hypothetical protein
MPRCVSPSARTACATTTSSRRDGPPRGRSPSAAVDGARDASGSSSGRTVARARIARASRTMPAAPRAAAMTASELAARPQASADKEPASTPASRSRRARTSERHVAAARWVHLSQARAQVGRYSFGTIVCLNNAYHTRKRKQTQINRHPGASIHGRQKPNPETQPNPHPALACGVPQCNAQRREHIRGRVRLRAPRDGGRRGRRRGRAGRALELQAPVLRECAAPHE